MFLFFERLHFQPAQHHSPTPLREPRIWAASGRFPQSPQGLRWRSARYRASLIKVNLSTHSKSALLVCVRVVELVVDPVSRAGAPRQHILSAINHRAEWINLPSPACVLFCFRVLFCRFCCHLLPLPYPLASMRRGQTQRGRNIFARSLLLSFATACTYASTGAATRSICEWTKLHRAVCCLKTGSPGTLGARKHDFTTVKPCRSCMRSWTNDCYNRRDWDRCGRSTY